MEGTARFKWARHFPREKLPPKSSRRIFNGDGKPDLVVADKGDEFATTPVAGAIYYLQNNGNGGFQAPVLVSVGSGIYPKHVVAGDVNGDGSRDIIFDGDADNFGNKVGILTAMGTAHFKPWS